jgi:hypothetical protein
VTAATPLPAPLAEAPRLFGAPAPPAELLPWAWAERRLASARNYWLATAAPNGGPHARPVWGVWVGAGLLFSTGSPVALRNLRANPEVSVHLGDGDDVVILEGTARRVTDRPTLRRYVDGLGAEYAYDAEVTREGFEGSDGASGQIFLACPRLVYGWGANLRDPTRWTWPEP